MGIVKIETRVPQRRSGATPEFLKFPGKCGNLRKLYFVRGKKRVKTGGEYKNGREPWAGLSSVNSKTVG